MNNSFSSLAFYELAISDINDPHQRPSLLGRDQTRATFLKARMSTSSSSVCDPESLAAVGSLNFFRLALRLL